MITNRPFLKSHTAKTALLENSANIPNLVKSSYIKQTNLSTREK